MSRSSDLFLERQFDDWVDSMSYDFDYDYFDYDRPRRTNDFYIKAVGVTYGNRQNVIKTLKVGDILHFVPEENNIYDKNAVLIVTELGRDIGYVSKDYNKDILQNIKKGVVYKLVVSNITGAYDFNNLGVNIKVSISTNLQNTVREQRAEAKQFIINNNVLEKYVGNSNSVVIPEEVAIIGTAAFDGCSFIEEVILPSKLKEIRTSAFWKCKSLKKINFPDSLQNIGIVAFGLCESLTTVCIPRSVSVIGERVFYGCKNLKEAKILSDVVEIGSLLFLECNNLKTIVLSDAAKNCFRRHRYCTKCGGLMSGFIFRECLDCKKAGRF